MGVGRMRKGGAPELSRGSDCGTQRDDRGGLPSAPREGGSSGRAGYRLQPRNSPTTSNYRWQSALGDKALWPSPQDAWPICASKFGTLKNFLWL